MRLFALALPWAESIVGLLVLVGIRTRFALVAGSFLILTLIVGATLNQPQQKELMMGKLEGKVALITGGNSGIGFGTAKLFAAECAHVYITGRRQEKLDQAVAEIGSNVTGVQGDVASIPDLNRLYEQIKSKHGKLDIVFANAGAAEYGPLGAITEEHFDRMFLGNVKGMVFTVQTMLPLLPDGASIITTSSVVGSKGLSANSIYAATKAAARSFARTGPQT